MRPPSPSVRAWLAQSSSDFVSSPSPLLAFAHAKTVAACMLLLSPLFCSFWASQIRVGKEGRKNTLLV
ncbi:hypothetical protein SORBI_3010G221700 [Sorghum bicolor]|uniref:Uncharacterized protein n=1 Tax=Sorghum bicolor TaxID=4558 RepID=A0A194YLU5_SORBI|nr:hypothetical protein SORBI_3010G221700 [Sorghum bicolor]